MYSNLFSPTRWFVSVDDSSLLKAIRDRHNTKVVFATITNGSLGHIGETDADKRDAVYMKTIIDNELLSKCDEMVITGGSTFGFIAAMRTKRLPYSVNNGGDKCTRTSLNDPPFQSANHLWSSFK
jgi:hypothetical protein